ncbi:MAG: hypothetical protein ACKVQR_16655 [Aquabacterium sp.]
MSAPMVAMAGLIALVLPLAVPAATAAPTHSSPKRSMKLATLGDPSWQLERYQDLPGASAAGPVPWRTGARLVLQGDRLLGPPPLGCAGARMSVLAVEPAGLFQGGLPAPAAEAARRIGLGPGPQPTLRIDCDNASLDLHLGRDGRWRLAIDGRIAIWRRVAAAHTPTQVVQDLLLRHLATSGQPLLYQQQVAAVTHWLHPRLRADFAGYFRHPWPKDEVPPLNGDPFTDSQEPVSRIELLAAETDGSVARQPLRLVFDAGAAGSTARLLHYRLRRDAGRWRVVDIVDDHGASLAGLLRQR